ncbi:conserved hypothetical protein, YceG family [Sphaerochaeta pleomorpha str. Grapes]|uniref:Endolytic murein transglycosylase n=1 Tax=Sphaerochaeta pleomorpha (strain ATCC BAA-1885 / DSM 22778 / Grapes) TaxID=158190 RepID=G8QS85_SPHPG|nr:endolytic transglycosylase MltG [Sphaerochaeta pleomorpha]AEV28946.1 conserved hypothetical protein, YceG family [Sphaerochaeta pleomorpha str. Grapes]
MANKEDDKQSLLDPKLSATQKDRKPKSTGPTSGKIILKASAKAPVEKPAVRKKPQVSSRKVTIKVPAGVAKPIDSEKPVTKTAKASTVKVSKKPTVKKQTIVRTVKRIANPVVQGLPEKPKKEAIRKTIQPPPLGKRKGYRPSLLTILKPIAFILSAIICIICVVLYFETRKPETLLLAEDHVPSSMQSVQREALAIQIIPGMTARQVCSLLEQQGVTLDGQKLLDFLVSQNLASVLRSGSYLMQADMDNESIANQLTSNSLMVSVTIPPGYTIAAIDIYLANRGYAKSGEFFQASEDLKVAYGLSFSEGWLLSGTYSIKQDAAAKNLALSMFEAMLQGLKPYLDSERVSLYGVDAVLIVASMIQAETQDPREMPLIASVIYNRLDADQPLGIDATTRYELNDWEKPIPSSALEQQTPYNTRRKTGLPPSGISSPSLQAIEAACFPQSTDYFYYLHGTDKAIHLAKTYEEHKRNIEKYL